MELKTFIFIGRSGCGKGTQVKLLMNYLNKNNSTEEIFYLQTGQHFRDFVEEDGLANEKAKKIIESGGRQPDFLAVWVWASAFIENINNEEHLIIDGTPRSLNEARMLDTAIRFYKRTKPFVVCLDVSRELSEERLLARGRSDDLKIGDIKKRLDWFEDDVLPAISFYRDNSDYEFVLINGEQEIESTHKDIIKKVFGE